MRLPQRSLFALLLAVGVATCSEFHPSPLEPSPGKGQLSFTPRFSPEAAAVYAQRAQFAAVNFDHVRIVLVRPPSETVKDTTIAFGPTSPPLTLELTVEIRGAGEKFNVSIDYLSTGVAMFHGQAAIPSHAPGTVPPQQPEIILHYVGPGADVTRLVISPKTPNVIAPAGVNFTAAAFDANNAPVLNAPLVWTTSDATVAAVNANTGVVTTTSKRGTATITASTPTNVHDDATLTVSLPPTGMTLVSGGGQTGKVGAALSQPAVVRVIAADGLGVAGVTVNFAAPTGGSVGASSVTTDAQGQASTTMTLGGALGPQSFAAVAVGFSVSIPATATAGDAGSIVAVSGSGQQDTVRRALGAPFVVRVTDSFGNALSGVTVSWTRTAGTGTLASATSSTNANGQASMTYTLGATPGQETISASVTGVATPATFTATAVAAGPAVIAIVSGNNQTGQVGQALPAPLIVKVTDAGGFPAAGVSVSWSATNGTIPQSTTTDAQGQTSASLTLGSAVGPATAVASIPTGTTRSATFSATATSGGAGTIVAVSGGGQQDTVRAPLAAPFVVRVNDSFGNAVSGVTVSWTRTVGTGTPATATATTNASGQASLSYTLGATAGQETVRASAAGVATSVTFTATAIPGHPANIAIVSGNGQTAQVGQALQAPLVVKVTDAGGNPVAGVGVSWSATNGTIAQSTTTDAQGQTSASLTLGSVAGPATAVASIPTGTTRSVTFTATATVGGVGSIVVVSGNSQRDTVRRALALPFVVRVADSFGNALSGVTVSWTRTAGTGTLGAATSTTNASGQASVSYTLGATPGQETVTASAAGVATPATFTATAIAAGPANIAIVSGNGQTGPIGQGLAAPLVVTVTDAGGFPVAGVSVNWSATNGTIAQSTTTDAQGQASASLILGSVAGPATAIASITSGTTTKSVTFTATAIPGAPANIAIVSGNGQTAQVGQVLVSPLVVKVTDAGGNAVAGVAVSWSATNGTIAQSTTTDAQGQTSASLTLGSVVGPATAVASIPTGTTRTATFSATATVGNPGSIVALSGSGQQDTVRRVLAAPFVVRVTDSFGNIVPGVTVSWSRTAGTGTLGAPTSTTNANGQASMTYTLGAIPGLETVRASVAGVAATFTATAVAAGPAAIAIVSGNNQTGQVGQALPAALVVKVTDAGGFPVAGVSVNWSATNGTITQSTTTDAQGQTSASLTVGPVVGTATAVASIPTGTTRSVTFTATVQPGAVAKLVFGTQPTTTAIQTPIKPAVTVELRDAAGNLTPSTNSVTIALGANPGQATLSGTLTRAAVAGVAVFDDLRISNAATGYTLVASSVGVPNVTSNAFDVLNPLQLQFFTTPPRTATSGLPLNPQPSIRVFTVAGLPTPGQPVTVTANSGTLGGTTVVTSNTDGVAAFSNLTLTGSGDIVLTFSTPGAAPLTTTVTVSQGSMIFIDSQGRPISQPTVTMIAGQAPPNPPGIRVLNAAGAGIPNVSVTYSVSTGGTTLFGGNAGTDASGSVSYTSLGLDPKNITQAGVYNILVSVPGFNQLTLNVTVQPGAPVRLLMTAGTLRPAPNTPDPIIGQLMDAFGNAVPKSLPVNWDWTGPGQLSSDRSTSTDASGKATATFVVPAGVAGPSTIFLTTPGLPTASIQLNPPAGLDLSLGSADASPVHNGNESKRGLNGETRIGAESPQHRY